MVREDVVRATDALDHEKKADGRVQRQGTYHPAHGNDIGGAKRAAETTPRFHGPAPASDDSYFLANRCGGEVVTRGQWSATFGHRIGAPSHTVNDGIFAGWAWDGTRLRAWNDRYGFQPMFWARLPGNGVGVSPSPLTLIEQGAPMDLNVEALAVFLRFGNFVGEDTPFAAIKALPPGARFTWTNGTLECDGGYPEAPPALTISRDDAIDRYIELFAAAMAKRPPTPGGCVVPVSGGRDSRHILLELHRTGHAPAACISAMDHPPDSNEDAIVGAAVCDALGFKHLIIDQQLPQFAAQLRKNRETHFCAGGPGWYLTIADFSNRRFASAYDGIGGDVLSNGLFLDAGLDSIFRAQDTAAVCEALLAGRASGVEPLHGSLKGPLKPCLDAALAGRRLAREVERHLGRPNPVGSFMFWNRTRRRIALAPYALLHGVPYVYAPYVDHDLFDFLAALPSSLLMDHRFHDDAIARAYPGFAHIRYARHTRPGAEDRATRTKFATDAARALLWKKPSRLVRNTGLRIKLAAVLLSRGHASPWISPMLIYLHQLESILDACSVHADGPPTRARTLSYALRSDARRRRRQTS